MIGIYMTVYGKICFTDQKAKNKAIEILKKEGFIKGYDWVDDSGDKIDGATSINDNSDCIVLDAGIMHNIHIPILRFAELGIIDGGKTSFKAVNTDGCFELSKWSKDEDGEYKWVVLSDEEVFDAVGVYPTKISFNDNCDNEEGEEIICYDDAVIAALDWAMA